MPLPIGAPGLLFLLFSQEDNYHFWIIIFFKMNPLVDNIKDLPEFEKKFSDFDFGVLRFVNVLIDFDFDFGLLREPKSKSNQNHDFVNALFQTKRTTANPE